MTQPTKGTVQYLATAALLRVATTYKQTMRPDGPEAERLKSLIANGADVHATNRKGETAAQIFARRNMFIAVQIMLMASSDTSIIRKAAPDGMTPFLWFASHNNEIAINHYLKFQPFHYELTTCDNKGRSAAYFFAEWGNVDMVSYMLELCPEVSQQGIMFAVQKSTKMSPHEKADAREAFRYAGF